MPSAFHAQSSRLSAGWTERPRLDSLAGEETAAEIIGQNPLGVLVVLALWFSVGLATATWMSLRGHDFRPFLALGIAMGPLLVPYARVRAQQAAPDYLDVVPSESIGPLLLVVLNGPAEEAADLLGLARRLCPPLQLVLAVSAPLEATDQASLERYLGRLFDGAVLYDELRPRLTVLRGRLERSIQVLHSAEEVALVVATRTLPFRWRRGEVPPVVLGLVRRRC
jgi:hypothetical protein